MGGANKAVSLFGNAHPSDLSWMFCLGSAHVNVTLIHSDSELVSFKTQWNEKVCEPLGFNCCAALICSSLDSAAGTAVYLIASQLTEQTTYKHLALMNGPRTHFIRCFNGFMLLCFSRVINKAQWRWKVIFCDKVMIFLKCAISHIMVVCSEFSDYIIDPVRCLMLHVIVSCIR